MCVWHCKQEVCVHLCVSHTPVALVPKRNLRPLESFCICSTRELMLFIHSSTLVYADLCIFSWEGGVCACVHACGVLPVSAGHVRANSGFAAHNDRCWKASVEPRTLIISCVPSKNIISTQTCNYTHTHTYTHSYTHSRTRSLHTLYHCFRQTLTPSKLSSFLWISLDSALLPSLSFSSFPLLPTTPMTLFSSIPTPSFQPVFISCPPFIHPYPPNFNPTIQLPCFHFFYLFPPPVPPPPPPASSSSSSWPKTDA